ncbi:Histidine kinase-, DNA gyrase B-, and HSP90-like ATPase [Dyadobacter sp. SG02]|uniref:sensor histidine kinase n=1 Tax=Dyadobacter sp. SG02 TaxID=1855291 RepID=UPI0008CFD06D|nr:ATP-binding protein [Dyadobacter sp. SG02]SEJ38058.1 Histidine kinase-, DNA gyrase B-, and HSP90-like ATPase [Dyadobacter sp. SG02]
MKALINTRYDHRLVILIFCLIPGMVNAQISVKLHRLLPDSMRPADRAHVTLTEAQPIFLRTFGLKGLGHGEYDETDSLCYFLAPKYRSIKDNFQRQNFLFSVCIYLYNSYANHTNNKTTLKDEHSPYRSPHAGSGLKYCNLFLEEYSRRPGDSYPMMLVLLIKAHFQIENDLYKDAYYNLQQLRNLSEKQKQVQMKAYAYNTLSLLFQTLSLTEQSLAYEDSAYQVARLLPTNNHMDNMFLLGIIQTRQQLFFDMLTSTGKRQFADSIRGIHQRLMSEPDEHIELSKSSSFVTVAMVNYRDRDYKNALANVDTALLIYPDFLRTSMSEEAIVTKGLSLMKLGKTIEGVKVLQSLLFQTSTGSIVMEALNELYNYELTKGNYRNALKYLNLQIRLTDRKHKLDLDGRALEMEQVHKAKTRENEIAYLKQLQNRNGLIFLFAITSILLVLAFILWRYRAGQIRTRNLVKRIDEAMQMQVSQIESAVDAERRLIGQQLHDDLSSSIGATFTYLRLTADEKHDLREKEQALAISKMLEASYYKARGKSHELYLEKDSSDFWKRFSVQVELLFSGSGIDFSLNGDLSGTILSPEIKTTLVMIVKEAITNIVKHSRATRAEILLYDDHHSVVIEVSDNGRGFSVEGTTGKAGLRSICERAEKLGGTAKWSSERHKNTAMAVRIPLPCSHDLHL